MRGNYFDERFGGLLRDGVLLEVALLDNVTDGEAQTRAVLGLLVSRPVPSVLPASVDFGACPNCGVAVESIRSPYCSDVCREVSAFVRQFRSAVLDRKIKDPEKQAALGQKLWHILGGGYPRRDVLVPARVRLKVIEREGSKCQQCGAKATTIDHSGSG